MAIRGYVVRVNFEGHEDWICRLGGSFCPCEKPSRTVFPALGEAIEAYRMPKPPGVAAIFRVHDDGREERLPSLEEALAEIERLRSIAPILLEGVPAIMHSSAPSSREEIGAAACEMLKAIERALSVLRGSEPVDPLAALEVAERRFLEAGGWVRIHGDPDKWTWPPAGLSMAQDQAMIVARARAIREQVAEREKT